MTRHAFNHCLADTQFESSALTVRESSRRVIKRAQALAAAEKGSINVNNSTRTRSYWRVPYGSASYGDQRGLLFGLSEKCFTRTRNL